jgi:hypothetical protein
MSWRVGAVLVLVLGILGSPTALRLRSPKGPMGVEHSLSGRSVYWPNEDAEVRVQVARPARDDDHLAEDEERRHEHLDTACRRTHMRGRSRAEQCYDSIARGSGP